MPAEVNEMVKYLGLTDKIQWDLALYWIFLINLVVLFVQPEGSAFGTLLGILVLVSAVIDKTYGFGYLLDPGRYTPEYYHGQIFIGTYLIRVVMFVAPLMIAGSTEQGNVRGLAILAGISGAVYMFARWYFDQRDTETSDIGIGYLHLQMAAQSAGVGLVLARSALRRRLGTVAVNGDVPMTVAGHFAAHHVEE